MKEEKLFLERRFWYNKRIVHAARIKIPPILYRVPSCIILARKNSYVLFSSPLPPPPPPPPAPSSEIQSASKLIKAERFVLIAWLCAYAIIISTFSHLREERKERSPLMNFAISIKENRAKGEQIFNKSDYSDFLVIDVLVIASFVFLPQKRSIGHTHILSS